MAVYKGALGKFISSRATNDKQVITDEAAAKGLAEVEIDVKKMTKKGHKRTYKSHQDHS